MKRAALTTLAFVPAILFFVLSLRPSTQSDLWFLAIIFGLPVIVFSGIVVVFALKTKRPVLRTTWPLLVSFALTASILLSNWPLRLAFRYAKPELDRLVQQFENGDEPTLPRHVGPFLIRDGGIQRGTPYLTVVANPAGPTRFVRASNSRGFNVWSEMKLSREWVLVKED